MLHAPTRRTFRSTLFLHSLKYSRGDKGPPTFKCRSPGGFTLRPSQGSDPLDANAIWEAQVCFVLQHDLAVLELQLQSLLLFLAKREIFTEWGVEATTLSQAFICWNDYWWQTKKQNTQTTRSPDLAMIIKVKKKIMRQKVPTKKGGVKKVQYERVHSEEGELGRG